MSDSRKLSQIVATGVGLIGVGALLYLGYRKFNPSKTVELLKEPLKGRSLHWVSFFCFLFLYFLAQSREKDVDFVKIIGEKKTE